VYGVQYLRYSCILRPMRGLKGESTIAVSVYQLSVLDYLRVILLLGVAQSLACLTSAYPFYLQELHPDL
jgi:hypothetical protein